MKKVFLSLSTLLTLIFASSAEELIEQNKCMNCHNIIGMKDAPPFSGIARHNSHWYGKSKDSIINSIKNGSKGKYPMFSNTQMPAYNHLSNEELNKIADWIFSQKSNKMHNGDWHCMMHNGNCNNK